MRGIEEAKNGSFGKEGSREKCCACENEDNSLVESRTSISMAMSRTVPVGHFSLSAQLFKPQLEFVRNNTATSTKE